MIANSIKNIALATIATSCVAFGIATEAQAFIGTLQISNEKGFMGDMDSIDFLDNDIEYYGEGVFSAFTADSDGSVGVTSLNLLTDPPVDSFFQFDEHSPSKFNLTSITISPDSDMFFMMYDLVGTVTHDNETYNVEGALTSQMMGAGVDGSSWSATLVTTTVPEPATILGLGVVVAGSAFGLKKKNS
ncbi:PEP-CTERM sorting domain-containing protein [Okeania sp. SIO3B5]|uniref:PEP-CTERM sorting domain-containing protein n=1 Tax=Okeania sp. SIO3B5 TaxID=2607811 RepID=UPI0025D29400|nr:PEP-CTERM sorting domain-containing protein [Okeania sp. SIO3B5]